MALYFEVSSKLGKSISITQERWRLITEIKHLEIRGKEKEIKESLKDPDEVRISKKDKAVYLYYKRYERLALAVVVKHINGEGFIITSYYTDKIKEGEQVYKK